MAQILSAYLAQQAARPFIYGTEDCATFAIGWLDRLTGKDGLTAWTGRYSDKESCDAYVAAEGGYVALAEQFFGETYGLCRTMPKTGNVVLGQFGQVTAWGIRVSDRDVALKTESRMLITRRAVILDEWGPA